MASNTQLLQDCNPTLLHPKNRSDLTVGNPIQSTGEAESETSMVINNEKSHGVSNENVGATGNIDQSQVLWRRIKAPSCWGLFPDSSPSVVRTRLYQVWPGNNVFFFRGRIMFGPDPQGFLLTVTSILLSNWIFCVYIGDSLKDQSVLLVPTSMILTVIVMVNLVLVGTRDPGIVPRNDEAKLQENTTIGRTRSMRINVDGFEVKLKYCRICKIFRPPRTCHCAVCDNCVEKFDHHCPWIGQCIGLRNYRYYMMFILSALVFFVYEFVISWWRIGRKISENGLGFFGTIGSIPETYAVELFSFMAIWFLGGLSIYHVYLITLNQTAHENFKRRYAKSPNPYDKGVLKNITEALFTRLQPLKINFRAEVEADYNSIARILKTDKELHEEEGQEIRTNATNQANVQEYEETFLQENASGCDEELPKKSCEVEQLEDVKLVIE